MKHDTRYCLICNKNRPTLYWHQDPKTNNIWGYCCSCSKGYSLKKYCELADISIEDFLKGDFEITNEQENELKAFEWPRSFISLSDPNAKPGVDYLQSRGLQLNHHFYYDLNSNGIVLPFYYGNQFVGAQIRLIEPWITDDGDTVKITTMNGTRTGLLFWNWNQQNLLPNVKAIIVTEGAFNAAAINQSLDKIYGSIVNNPFKAIAMSGSGAGEHIQEALQELKGKGYRVISATDFDPAGLKAFKKLADANCLTHYAFTNEEGKDWNDLLLELGSEEFANFFLKQITKLEA